MKTITTQKIDGYDIITGVHDAYGLIDPVQTRKAVMDKIDKTDEFKALENVRKQMQVYANQAVQAKRNAATAKTEQDKTNFWNEYKQRAQQIKDMEPELKIKFDAVQKKQRNMIKENAVYFKPKEGEIFIDENKASNAIDAMKTAIQNGQVVDKDLNLIDDNRGKIFWAKIDTEWKKDQINELGKKPKNGYIEEKNLTPEQKTEIGEQLECERIAGLSQSEKDAEKQMMINVAVTKAGIMKNELEVKGVADALEQAQAWLDSEMTIINDKYI